jgi:hypothetical protein
MKPYILAAVLAAVPLAAHAGSTEDHLTHFALSFFHAKGDPDCNQPISRLSLQELDTCKTLLEQARTFVRPLAIDIDKQRDEDAATAAPRR